ncbi:MAG TPA: hypothetical protein PKA66_12335 [Gemmatimonadales bacterium]|nr:hypothetical protein [Gemmatimonadales bacterium]
MSGEIRWDGSSTQASAIGRISWGSTLSAMAVMMYLLFSILVARASVGRTDLNLLDSFLPVMGIAVVGLIMVVGVKSARSQFDDFVEEADSLIQREGLFAVSGQE